MTGVVRAVEPGRKIVSQFRKGVKLPVWFVLELADDSAGVAITHTIRAGFSGFGRLFDPIFRLYFSRDFERAMDAHARTEFPRLRDLLHGADGPWKDVQKGPGLADFNHPPVIETARKPVDGETTARG